MYQFMEQRRVTVQLYSFTILPIKLILIQDFYLLLVQ